MIRTGSLASGRFVQPTKMTLPPSPAPGVACTRHPPPPRLHKALPEQGILLLLLVLILILAAVLAQLGIRRRPRESC